MNDSQKKLLDLLQSSFPLSPRPFEPLAAALNAQLIDFAPLTEDELVKEVSRLKEDGLLRRIGPFFSAVHLGYTSTLIAARVLEDVCDHIIAEVNAHPGVSHNYGRDHKFNIWFTLTVSSSEHIEQFIEHLRQKYQLPAIFSLPALKMFKLDARFSLSVDHPGATASLRKCKSNACASKPLAEVTLSQEQIELIRQLQNGLDIIPEPFHKIAQQAGWDVTAALDQIKQWLASGLIRRFGAAVRHHRAGFAANGMVVFELSPEQIESAGEHLASLPHVTHCYQRPTAHDWPYNLFAMTHAHDQPELNMMVENMVRQIRPRRYDILLTTAEYKKQPVKFFQETAK